ncbi:MAG: hypothetical protein ACI4PP_04010 [Clostridia bacterium]
MKTLILLGPLGHETGQPPENGGILMEFTPFRKNCITETDARRAAAYYDTETPRYGRFASPSPNQLLYFFSENLINGAILTEADERTLLRLAETVKAPIFLAANTDREESLRQRERLPVRGLYFPSVPSSETLKNRKKPYMTVFPETRDEETEALFRRYPPFALHCKTEDEAEKAARWIKKISKEMR